MLTLLPPNTAYSSFAIHTQESCSRELAETLLQNASRLDGYTRVVLLQGEIYQVYLGTLELW